MFEKKKKDSDLEMFTVYDSKTDSYRDPLFAVNSLDVLREFQNAFQDPDAPKKNSYFKNAEDFSLFKIGSYHRKTGLCEAHQPTHVVNFHELKAQALRENARNMSPGIVPT